MAKDRVKDSGLNTAITVSGKRFGAHEIALLKSLAAQFPGLSRNELALTLCELIDWNRPSGRPKGRECLDLFDRLEDAGVCRFPPKKKTRPRGVPSRARITPVSWAEDEISGDLGDLLPVSLEQVATPQRHRVWRDLVGRFHYLGCVTAFGASMRFFILDGQGRCLGCLQYSSPAWRIRARDEWIGWSDAVRRANLQRVVSQSRFLILPWVRVPNLASHALAKSARELPAVWHDRFNVSPLLLETLVDTTRYEGTCYRAANWIWAGDTSGRGRMDREHLRHGAEVKRLFLYPLVADARRRLLGDPSPPEGARPGDRGGWAHAP
jgi:hypothetical protein